jgi:hypothetical protein
LATVRAASRATVGDALDADGVGILGAVDVGRVGAGWLAAPESHAAATIASSTTQPSERAEWRPVNE